MAGVYVSYPFCGQKCTYCNFSSAVATPSLEHRYLDAVTLELQSHAWEWTPETLYIGGGSPSRLDPAAIERLMTHIPGQPWREATVELAPGEVTASRARAWRRAGITRASLGVQSFEDSELRQTGRRHNAATVASDVALLREAGITGINLDLIAGLPRQNAESWRRSMDWIARLDPPHVSVYMLEADTGSRLGLEILRHGERYGAALIPPEDQTAAFYEYALDELARLGLCRYEISNFARPGHESLHNLKYWRLEPYAGFGADAHGFDGRRRWSNVEPAHEYVDRLERGESPRAGFTDADPACERFFVGLRLSEGIEPAPDEWRRWDAPIGRFVDAGLLERDCGRLRLSRRGVLLSNEVLQEFV